MSRANAYMSDEQAETPCANCGDERQQHGGKYGCEAGKTTRMPAGGCDIDMDHDCGCPKFTEEEL